MKARLLVVAMLFGGVAFASAGDVPMRFTHPNTNCDGTPLSDLRGEKVYLRRVPLGEEITVGELPAVGREGKPDSFVVELAESVHYAVVSLGSIDLNGREGGRSNTWLAAVPQAPPVQLAPGLQATYFDNKDLQVPWYAARVDTAISFDWDYAAPLPGMGVETFSIRWEGYILAPISGLYSFRAQVEDGCRAWIGPTPVCDDWAVQEEHGKVFVAQLAQGANPFRFEYFANNGDAAMRLYWTRPGALEQVVPSSALWHLPQVGGPTP